MGSYEFLIGTHLSHTHHETSKPSARDTTVKLILKRHQGTKGLKFGPVRFHLDGTLTVSSKRFPPREIPEAGLEAEGVTLLRSGADLIAIRHKAQLMIFSYTEGHWYHGEAPKE